MLIFEEEMAKIGIEANKELIEQSKETDIAILRSDLTEEQKQKYLKFEQEFRQWAREEKKKERQKLLDIKG